MNSIFKTSVAPSILLIATAMHLMQEGGFRQAGQNIAAAFSGSDELSEKKSRQYSENLMESIKLLQADVIVRFNKALQDHKDNNDINLDTEERCDFIVNRLDCFMHQLQNAYDMLDKGNVRFATYDEFATAKKQFLLIAGTIPDEIEKEASAKPEIRKLSPDVVCLAGWELIPKLNESGQITDIIYKFDGDFNSAPLGNFR